MLLTFLNILATIIGVISLLIVTYGVFVGFIAFLRNEFKRINGTYTINNVRQLRADFGSYLLLGLEFLIASSAARNTGILASVGDYLYFLDSDDYISANAIELLADAAVQKRPDFVIGNYEVSIPGLELKEKRKLC